MWGLDAPNQLAVIPATFKRISFSVWFDKKSKACSTQRDSDHHILLVNLGRNDTKAVQASDAVGVFREHPHPKYWWQGDCAINFNHIVRQPGLHRRCQLPKLTLAEHSSAPIVIMMNLCQRGGLLVFITMVQR